MRITNSKEQSLAQLVRNGRIAARPAECKMLVKADRRVNVFIDETPSHTREHTAGTEELLV